MRITAQAAKALKSGETYSEKVAGRGAGTLLLVGRDGGVSAYYRYTEPGGKRPWIELGQIGRDVSLADARSRCQELAVVRQEHPHLQEWLALERSRAVADLQAEVSRASLGELLGDYVASLHSLGRSSAAEVERMFRVEIQERHRALWAMKAKDVTPAHVLDLLRPLTTRGAKVYRNRLRSYLHAAFAFAMRSEFDETRESGKTFSLVANPVTPVPPLAGVERPGERALSDQELLALYEGIHQVPSVGPIVGAFLRFMVATAGQRPLQLLAARWEDYEPETRTVRIIDRKGRGGRPRVHLVPLTDRALEILETVRPFTYGFAWPFSSSGHGPLNISSLKVAITRLRSNPAGAGLEHFTPRDVRRTAKQLMTRAGVRRDLRNLLQNHGQTGVDASHYDNDPTAHLAEKRQAMMAYEAALASVLEERNSGARIITMARAPA